MLFRSRQIVLLRIADSTPLYRLLSIVRETASPWQPSEWVVFSLPGGLWSAAYILIIHSLMAPLTLVSRWRWAIVIPMLGALSELCQAFHVLPGTFDVVDLLCYLLPFLLYTLYLTFKISRYER